MHSPERPHCPGAEILRLARGSIEHGLIHGEPLPVSCGEFGGVLAEPRATFTTLKGDGRDSFCLQGGVP
jgi:hypothetical protein